MHCTFQIQDEPGGHGWEEDITPGPRTGDTIMHDGATCRVQPFALYTQHGEFGDLHGTFRLIKLRQ